MNMCAVIDGDGCEFSRVETRKAKKTHICRECFRVIHPGETYHYASGKSEGRMWSAKTCAHCDVAATWLLENCNGFLFGGVIEDFNDHAEGRMDMLRLTVGSRRKWRSFTDPARLMPIPAMPAAMDG
jgi:hypothetical protein